MVYGKLSIKQGSGEYFNQKSIHYFLIPVIVMLCLLSVGFLETFTSYAFKTRGYSFALTCHCKVLLLEIFVKHGKAK